MKEPEPLKKIPGAGAAWGKKSGAGATRKKSGSGVAKKLCAPQPGIKKHNFCTERGFDIADIKLIRREIGGQEWPILTRTIIMLKMRG